MNKHNALLLAVALAAAMPLAPAAAAAAPAYAALPTQEWRMLPGESLNSLAALIYPGNRAMQRRFVAATQTLNRDMLGERAAGTPFEQETVLRIPELHALSRYAAPKAASRRAAPAAVTAGASAVPEVGAGERQQQLQELNGRLQELEAQAADLKQKLAASQLAPAGTPAAGDQPAAPSAALAPAPPVASADSAPDAPKRVTLEQPAAADDGAGFDWRMPLIGLLALVLGVGLYLRRREQAKAR